MPPSGTRLAEAPPIRPAATHLLPSCRLVGPWQMAIDHWMLEQGQPALRLYRWQRPTLSVGWHQRSLPPHWLSLAEAGHLDLVRRPSGGQAVLHGGDLSYALVWPDPPRGRRQAYAQACRWLQAAFEQLGQPLHFGTAAATQASPDCFASSTAADLVHAHGAKRIGSAQLWRAGRLLQHGSIQLAPDRQLWQQLFDAAAPDLPPLPASDLALESLLLKAAAAHLPLPVAICAPLRAAELAPLAQRLASYRWPGGTVGGNSVGGNSPEASMPRTTWGSASPSG